MQISSSFTSPRRSRRFEILMAVKSCRDCCLSTNVDCWKGLYSSLRIGSNLIERKKTLKKGFSSTRRCVPLLKLGAKVCNPDSFCSHTSCVERFRALKSAASCASLNVTALISPPSSSTLSLNIRRLSYIPEKMHEEHNVDDAWHGMIMYFL